MRTASADPWSNGGVAWALGLGALFAVDLALVRSHRPSMSAHARRHRVLTACGLGVLVHHLYHGERPC